MNDEAFSGKIAKTIITKVFATLAIYIVSIVALFLLGGIVLRRFIWQPENVFYRIFKTIENNYFLLLIIGIIAGFVIIFAYYWRKSLKYIDLIVDASEVLAGSADELVTLPNELKPIELHLNTAKQHMAHNARLAKEAEQRKNDLIVYLAHDIKTPLTSVVGYLSLLDEAADMPSEQRTKYVHVTLEKAYRLEQLINEFFEITRYNLSTIVLSKTSIDLNYMLMQMADEFYPTLTAKGQSLKLSIPDDLTVTADGDKLARVFNNIIKNASAYSPSDSVISITAAKQEGMVSIVFKNKGSIAREKLAQIFDKFYRVDEARSSGSGGAGLGLAIAKEIVVQHGGQIYATSAENSTKFTVELPTG